MGSVEEGQQTGVSNTSQEQITLLMGHGEGCFRCLWGPLSYLYDTGATVGVLALNDQGHGGWRGRGFPQSEFEFTEKQEQEAAVICLVRIRPREITSNSYLA